MILSSVLNLSEICDGLKTLWEETIISKREHGCCISREHGCCSWVKGSKEAVTPGCLLHEHRRDHVGFVHTHVPKACWEPAVGFSTTDFITATYENNEIEILIDRQHIYALVRTVQRPPQMQISSKSKAKRLALKCIYLHAVFLAQELQRQGEAATSQLVAQIKLAQALGYILFIGPQFGEQQEEQKCILKRAELYRAYVRERKSGTATAEACEACERMLA